MGLFSSERTTDYFHRISSSVEREINAFSDEKILGSNLQDWIDYYSQKHALTPISLFEESLSQSIENDSVQEKNLFFTNPAYEKQYFEKPAYRVKISVPFDGTADLLQLMPSSRILIPFDAEVVKPSGDKLGKIILSFTFSAEEMKSKPDLQAFVRGQFNTQFEHYRKMIGYVNAEANLFNTQLNGSVISWLYKRKEKAAEFSDICTKLNIPMIKSENAPNTIPIQLTRVVRQVPVAPQAKKLEPEYGISDTDYQNIQNIIDMFCISCEKTPMTYNKLTEEEIRDTLISTLNTHYSNVSGEAFRKKGKTDILIEFDNKAGYIAECKIWHGIQALQDALSQLNGYMTWRDYKVTLVFFNKTNRDFARVRAQIDEWVKSNSTNVNHTKANIWSCLIKRADKDEYFQLSIRVYDLYVAS